LHCGVDSTHIWDPGQAVWYQYVTRQFLYSGMVCCVFGCIRSNSTKSSASGTYKVGEPSLMSQVRSVLVHQCVSAVTVVEVAVVCLCSSCSCDRARGTVRFVGFALKVVVQNDA
jgi:hypothetical protein